MSAANLRKSITDVLKSGYSGTPPIFAENLTIPANVVDGEWSRWSIRMAATTDADVGATVERSVGTLYFQHFVPEGSGTKQAYDFADKIGALLNRLRTGTGGVLTFERAVPIYIGVTDGKVQHNITVAFRWDANALNAA